MKKTIISMIGWYALTISLGSAIAGLASILPNMPEEEIRFVWKGFGTLCVILAGVYLILGSILLVVDYQENKNNERNSNY